MYSTVQLYMSGFHKMYFKLLRCSEICHKSLLMPLDSVWCQRLLRTRILCLPHMVLVLTWLNLTRNYAKKETSRHQVSHQQQWKQLYSLPPSETSLFGTVCFVLIRQLIVVSTQSSCGATAIQLCSFFNSKSKRCAVDPLKAGKQKHN